MVIPKIQTAKLSFKICSISIAYHIFVAMKRCRGGIPATPCFTGRTMSTLLFGAQRSGVAVEHHLFAKNPLIKSLYLFHTYYQVKRTFVEIKDSIPEDNTWTNIDNEYDKSIMRDLQTV